MDEAIKCFEKVLEIDPNDARAWYNKGTTCIVIGRAEEAVTCLDKAVEIDPTVLKKAHFPKDS